MRRLVALETRRDSVGLILCPDSGRSSGGGLDFKGEPDLGPSEKGEHRVSPSISVISLICFIKIEKCFPFFVG